MTDRLLQANQTLQYLYCDGPDIDSILDECAACLDTVPNAKALGHCKANLIQWRANAVHSNTRSRCRSHEGRLCAETEGG